MATAKETECVSGADIGAVAGWLGSYGGEDSQSDIQRGMFSGEIGTPSALHLFELYLIKAGWFIPAHWIETLPAETRMFVGAGHEVGAYGYSYENPESIAPTQEEDVMRTITAPIPDILVKAPRGYVAPSWEMSCVPRCARSSAEADLGGGLK